MRYSSNINNVKALEWGLDIKHAYLFAWFYELPSWANKVIIENECYYFASKNKAVDELPLLTDKIDTMYRFYKKIESLGLVKIKKIDGKDYIMLTEKAKKWNASKSEHSEKNPTQLGKKSESNSEKNPTNNTNKNDNKTIDKKIELPFKTEKFKKAWEYWKKYKKDEFKFRYKSEISENTALKDLEHLSGKNEKVAIEIIRQSISKTWKGLFELKEKTSGKKEKTLQENAEITNPENYKNLKA